MATLAAGGTTSATLYLDAFASVTVVRDHNCAGVLTFTSAAQNLKSNFTAKVQNKTYGPFGVPGTLVIAVTAGSMTYAVNGTVNGAALSQVNDSVAATANTAAIQTALNAGGLVQITTPGTYYINAALVYVSNTRLVLAPGVEIKMFAGSNKAMLQPSNLATFNAGGTTVTLTYSSGVNFTVGWTAHGKVAGQAVYLWNGTGTPFIGVFKIETITDANNFVCTLPYVPAAAPSGTWKAIQAVQNFTLEGGLWNYNNPNNVGSALDAHALCIFFSENCHVKKPTQVRDAAKYCLNSCGTLNCTYEIDSPTTASDGVKVYGPARSTHVLGITGYYGDDAYSVQNFEWLGAYQPYQPAAAGGEIYDCTAKRIQASTSGTASLCSVYVADSVPMDRIEVDGVYGSALFSPLRMQGQSQANSKVGTIHFRNSGGIGSASNGDFYSDTVNVGTLTLENVKLNPAAISSSSNFVFNTNTTFKQINIIRPDISALGWLSATNAPSIVSSGTVNHIVITDPYLASTGSFTGGLLAISAGSCAMVTIENGYIPSGGELVTVAPSLSVNPIINVRNCNLDGLWSLVNGNGTCEIHLSGNRINNLQQGIVRFNNTATVTIRSDGTNQWVGSSVTATYNAGTATLAMYGFDIPYDVITGIASVTLGAANGQFINSTRTGATNLGPAIKNPAGWVALGTGAAGANTVIT